MNMDNLREESIPLSMEFKTKEENMSPYKSGAEYDHPEDQFEINKTLN